jgi:SET domain-containing protein
MRLFFFRHSKENQTSYPMPQISSRKPYEIRRARSGLGLFATKPIRKGQFIIRYTGPKLNNDQADKADNQYLFELNNRWTIDGKSRKNVARYINHSCRPNAEVYFVGHAIKIRARKKIEPGEEIAYDYGKDHFNAYIKPKGCQCPKCREKRAEERKLARKRRERKKKKMKKRP